MESTKRNTEGMKLGKVSDHVRSCKACCVGKPVRQTLQNQADTRSVNSATRLIEKLHTDLVGPTKTAFLNLSKCCVILLKEYSGDALVRLQT